jgi:hypothetical protein
VRRKAEADLAVARAALEEIAADLRAADVAADAEAASTAAKREDLEGQVGFVCHTRVLRATQVELRLLAKSPACSPQVHAPLCSCTHSCREHCARTRSVWVAAPDTKVAVWHRLQR